MQTTESWLRRGRMEMWLDVMMAIQASEQSGRKTSSSRIQSTANLPYQRFMDCLHELKRKELVHDKPLRLTPQGHWLIGHARPVLETLKSPSQGS